MGTAANIVVDIALLAGLVLLWRVVPRYAQWTTRTNKQIFGRLAWTKDGGVAERYGVIFIRAWLVLMSVMLVGNLGRAIVVAL